MLPCQTAPTTWTSSVCSVLQWIFFLRLTNNSKCHSKFLCVCDAVLFLGRRAMTGSCFSSWAMMGPMCVRWLLSHLWLWRLLSYTCSEVLLTKFGWMQMNEPVIVKEASYDIECFYIVRLFGLQVILCISNSCLFQLKVIWYCGVVLLYSLHRM